MSVCTRAHVRVCAGACTCVRGCMYVCVCMHASMYACVRAFVGYKFQWNRVHFRQLMGIYFFVTFECYLAWNTSSCESSITFALTYFRPSGFFSCNSCKYPFTEQNCSDILLLTLLASLLSLASSLFEAIHEHVVLSL